VDILLRSSGGAQFANSETIDENITPCTHDYATSTTVLCDMSTTLLIH